MNNLHDLPTSPQDPLDQRTAWLGGGDEFERKTEKSWKRRVVCLFLCQLKCFWKKYITSYLYLYFLLFYLDVTMNFHSKMKFSTV